MSDVNEGSQVVNNLIIQLDENTTNNLLEQELRRTSEDWKKQNKVYPYQDGEYTVLGPEIFTDGKVVCWQGEIYVPQGHLPSASPNVQGATS